MTAAATIAQLEAIVARNPGSADGWRALGDAWTARGNVGAADAAYAQSIRAGTRDPELLRAANALVAGELAVAEPLLRARLKRAPTDVAAIRMLAELASRLGRYGDAEKLLARVLQLAPGFRAARHNYALVLHRQNRAGDALEQIDLLLADDPANAGLANLKAAVLGRIGEFGDALDLYDQVLARQPDQPKVWMSYGHSLKTVGRQSDAVQAYRRSIALEPGMGEAWWSLANLKTFRFTPEDLATMRAAVDNTSLETVDRVHFHFALGKACEDAADYADSFHHYDSGNTLHRASTRYDANQSTARVQRLRQVFTRDYFVQREGMGHAARDPIFIVGMPRAGSTLLEQILSSHSAVEGTSELPDIIAIARELRGDADAAEIGAYAEALSALDAGQLQRLGEDYLQRTRIYRKTGRQLFIDKMPNNFLHVGLIHSILPNAKIIDARRHPLGCCLSNFKQFYARGQRFSYGLTDVGRYYHDYVALMAHFDTVLPGRVHRVIYEQLVDDTEAEVRRLLDYCELPFEEGCLRFFENARPVRTASSEQVRRPIYREGVDQWRNYEPWLEPLQTALGAVLAAYPEVPAEFR